jgi:N-acetylglucosamine-6-sulfatase
MAVRPLGRARPALAALVLLGLALGAPQAPTHDTAARAATTEVGLPAALPLAHGSQPNIVLVMTDDMTVSDLRWMPQTRRLLGRHGTTFTEAIAPNPLCCPARAALITGLESHNSGVWSNSGRYGGYQALHRTSRLQHWLRGAGYRTAFLGKHLNGYTPRRTGPEGGWTVHDPLVRGIYSYRRFASWNDGDIRWVRHGYVTQYLTQATKGVLRRFEHRDAAPFFVWVSHVAPHNSLRPGCTGAGCWAPPRPALRDWGDLRGVRAPELASASFNQDGGADKPYFLRGLDAWDEADIQRLFQRRIESLQAVDRSVAATVAQLRRLGELRRTLFVFTSDNGYLLGEHRYVGKRLPYEGSVRVPLLVRGPGVLQGATVHDLVTTPDLTRTFVHVAGAEPAYPLDGVVLRGLLTDRRAAPPRAATILQTGGPAPYAPHWAYRGYRDARYTYARYPDDGSGSVYEELYDRRLDPSELDNVAGSPAYAEVLRLVQERARTLLTCSGATCHPDWPALPGPDV